MQSVCEAGVTEVVVVDNASSDGSAAMVAAEFPAVTLVANPRNQGYGAAANQGVARCTAPHVLVLNSDTLLSPSVGDRLSRYLDVHPAVALVGPRLTNLDGTDQLSCFPCPGTLRWLLENDPVALIVRWVPPLRRRLLRFSPPTEPRAVPWVLGAAVAVRRRDFEAVRGFDESFFMYFEEVDLCWRLWRAGKEVHYDPRTTIVHVGGGSTAGLWREMTLQHFASTLRFYRRHYDGARLTLWLSLMRAKMLLRLFRDALRGRFLRDEERRSQVQDRVEIWRRALQEDTLTHELQSGETPGP